MKVLSTLLIFFRERRSYTSGSHESRSRRSRSKSVERVSALTKSKLEAKKLARYFYFYLFILFSPVMSMHLFCPDF